jgi:hypothetical protein
MYILINYFPKEMHCKFSMSAQLDWHFNAPQDRLFCPLNLYRSTARDRLCHLRLPSPPEWGQLPGISSLRVPFLRNACHGGTRTPWLHWLGVWWGVGVGCGVGVGVVCGCVVLCVGVVCGCCVWVCVCVGVCDSMCECVISARRG